MEILFLFLRLNSFNSIKVRLKLSTSSYLGKGRLFQFHKGAIKTHIDKKTKVTVYWGL